VDVIYAADCQQQSWVWLITAMLCFASAKQDTCINAAAADVTQPQMSQPEVSQQQQQQQQTLHTGSAAFVPLAVPAFFVMLWPAKMCVTVGLTLGVAVVAITHTVLLLYLCLRVLHSGLLRVTWLE
jgi:small neutral amino acid transporter SnatA (MarC family)